MLRKLSLDMVSLLLLPATLLAGGPPRLYLPIDGVTAKSAQASAEKLTGALADKLWKYDDEREVKIVTHGDQRYIAFPMAKDVALSDVEAALKGSRLSVPRDRLHLFGHVILEIEIGKASAKELLSSLEDLKFVSVGQSRTKKDRLLVTVDMPYPEYSDGFRRGILEWETFRRNDFSSDQATRSEPPAKAADLPNYGTFRDAVAKQGASLKEVRWSPEFACRELGGVAVEETRPVAAAAAGARSAD